MTQTTTSQTTTSPVLTSSGYELTLINPAAVWTPAPPAARRFSLRCHLAQRWDLYGILALMASCAAYGISALAHLV